MQTKVSTKGQVVLPGPLRRRLDIRAGDPLDANIEDGNIVLTPRKKRAQGRSKQLRPLNPQGYDPQFPEDP
jgi:AbrB family looped-hinge helix DNA binding protein